MTFAPSLRGASAPASPIRRLTPYADRAKQRGLEVIHLNIGQPDVATPRTVIDAYHHFDDKVLAYGASEGSLDYRQALAAYYNGLGAHRGGPEILPSDVVVTTGGSEALLFAIAATCDPGDELLVAEPYYPNYHGFAHLLSVQVKPVTTFGTSGFSLSADQVEAALGPRTKAVVLSSPGNPTGAVLSSTQLRSIGDVCVKHGVFFICDEVYRDFVYDDEIREGGTTSPSILAQPGLSECAIMVDSVSKRYSACGARVGCLVTRNTAIRAAIVKIAQARLSPPVVDMLAAQAALATPASELAAVTAEYRRRRDALVLGLSAIPGVSARTPQGAFYLVVRLPVDDAERFCIYLLEQFDLDGHTLMLAPADGFYATTGLGKQEVRAAYVLEVEKLQRACDILRAALAAYPGAVPA